MDAYVRISGARDIKSIYSPPVYLNYKDDGYNGSRFKESGEFRHVSLL